MQNDTIAHGHDNPENYDQEAKSSNWLGPQVAFGLTYEYITPGDTILDIGIGTGLTAALFHKAGFKVIGMDISQGMLDACRKKQITAKLIRHDLTSIPWPMENDTLDHVICTGVMQFFEDLSIIFRETSRLLRNHGIFTFIVADRKLDDSSEIHMEHDQHHLDVTMYRHSMNQIREWTKLNALIIKESLEFPVFMDPEHHQVMKARVYVSIKTH